MSFWKRPIALMVSLALVLPPVPVIGASGALPAVPANADPQSIPGVRPRLALVIGNSKYTHVSSLMTSVNDATDVASVLEKLGFHVTRAYEADIASMKKAAAEFSAQLKTDRYRDALAVFYFAGHGTQSGGRNFLLPVDVRIEKGKLNFDEQAMDVNEDIVRQFSRLASGTRPGPNIIILDACRDDPLGGRPGLSRVEVPSGTLLAFAAAAGQQAIDTLDRNKPGRNGLYTRFLLQELNARNRVDVEKLFKVLKRKVFEASVQRQDPLIMPNLIEDVFLEPENTTGRATPEEVAAWKSIENSIEGCDFTSFLAQFPGGEFAESARATLDEIRKKAEIARRAFADLPDGVREQAIKAFKEKETESQAWCEIRSSDQIKDINAFLEAYPAGRNANRARIRISVLEQRDQEKRQREAERVRQQSIEAERLAWRAAEQTADPVQIDAFLRQYPASEYRPAAEHKLAELQQRQRDAERQRQEDHAWSQVKDSKDAGQLQAFLASYPSGRHAAEAGAQIEGIMAALRVAEERIANARRKEAQDWETARLGGKQADLAAFIASYPDSVHRADAAKLLDALRAAEVARLRETAHAQVQRARQEEIAWTEAETLKRREAYQSYAERYPAGRFIAEAHQRIAALDAAQVQEARRREEQQFLLVREYEAWEKIRASSNPADFIAYLQAHSDGAHAADARSRIAALEAIRVQVAARQEEEWSRIKDSRDIAVLRAFAERAGPYASAAQGRIAVLEEAVAREKRDADAARIAAEDAAWQVALQTNRPESFHNYLNSYPAGRYAAQASNRINLLAEAPLATGTAENPEFAKKLNKAEQGDTDAMYHLALMYESGADKVKTDKSEMLKWLLLSSNLGNGLASYKLYAYYAADATGYAKSIKYRNLATKQGYCGPPGQLGNVRGKGAAASVCGD